MPVDIASGKVELDFQDVSVPGKVDLTWERNYSSGLLIRPPTAIGNGWTSRYFATLTQKTEGFEFVTPQGTAEVFVDPEGLVERGGRIINFGSFLELFKQANQFIVQSWDAESGNIWRYCFTAGTIGQVLFLGSIEDVTGKGIDLVWNNQGRLISINQQIEKRSLILAYSSLGFIDAVTFKAATGENYIVARYEHSAQGQLTAAYDAAGNADRYEYDRYDRLTREVTKHGGVFSYHYDSKNRCVSYTGLEGYDKKRLRFLEAARVTEVTNSYGDISQYAYLPSGQIISKKNPLGAESTTTYDEYGRIIATTTPTGATARYEYDEQGNRCKIIDPVGNTYLLTFNRHHQPTTLTDPNGNLWSRDYDQSYRLIRTVDPLGASWSFQYDQMGNLIALINPKGDIRTFRYADGVLTEETDWMGNLTRVEFDALGRMITETNPLGNTFTYDYDATGNLVRVVLPDGAQFLACYNASGDLVKLTDPVGRVTTQRFGPCRLLQERIDPNGSKVSYVWGTEPERLEQVINERGEEFRFFYNAAGHCTKEVSFDGREHKFAYDDSGWCISVTNGAGETIKIKRDLLGRIAEQILPDGNITKYTYDKFGGVIDARNSECAVQIERNIVGHRVREVQGDHWVDYVTDPLGEVIRMQTDLGHRVEFDLDPNGHWKGLRAADRYTVQFRRDASGQEVERVLPGGLRLHQHYDPVGRLIQQRLAHNGISEYSAASWMKVNPNDLVHRGYDRDASGLVQTINDHYSGATHYTYDPGERLLGVRRGRGLVERFEYDVAGNLTRSITERAGNAEDEVFVYGKGNRLLSKGDTQYEYDGQGRLVRKLTNTNSTEPKIWSYKWDALDQLCSVTQPNGEVWRYGYDGFGRRVRKTGPKNEVCFVWSGSVPVHEISTDDKDCGTWIHGQDSFVPLAHLKNGTIYSVIEDHLGTPQEMVDSLGMLVWRSRCNAHGGKDFELGKDISCPFRFQGQYYDAESGLHYNMFRYYDPDIGRFISQDPIGLLGGNNLYQYAPNPIAWIDPWGWVAAPPTLPNTPGIYTITNGNDCYVGSAGIGQQGMSDRISDPSHTKAQDLLSKPGTTVEFKEVDLGSANTAKDRNRILRHFEQQEIDLQAQKGKKLSNGPRAEAESKNARNAKIVAKKKAAVKPQQKC